MVQLATSRKHLVLILDSKPDFNEYIGNEINKWNKIVGIMKAFFNPVKKGLLTMYKSFVRSYLDYANIIYD